jgi:hypothetical protein
LPCAGRQAHAVAASFPRRVPAASRGFRCDAAHVDDVEKIAGWQEELPYVSSDALFLQDFNLIQNVKSFPALGLSYHPPALGKNRETDRW